MSKKKILITVDWFLPGFKAGGPIRSCYYLVRALADRFDFYILTGDRDLGDKAAYQDLTLNEWLEDPEGYHVQYLTPGYRSMRKLKKLIRELKPDIIYVNGMYSRFFSILPVVLNYVTRLRISKLIVTPRGMLQKGAVHQKAYKKRPFLFLYKWLFKRDNIEFHVTDAQEKEDVIDRLGINEDLVTVIGNIPMKPVEKVRQVDMGKSLRLIYVSRLTPKKNILGLLRTLSGTSLQIELNIFGEFESALYRQKCIRALKLLPPNVKAEFKGLLHPGSLRNALSGHHFFILLTKGENFGHAIFESLAVGRPVILGQHTPWNQVEKVGAGFIVDIEDQNEILSTLNRAASMDQEKYDQYCQAAWDFANEYYYHSGIQEQYLELFGR